MSRRLWPVAAAGGAAVIGLLLLVVGLLVATVGAPAATETLTLRPTATSQAVTSAPGVLELRADRVEVRASAEGRRVVLAVARTDDATSYLGKAERVEITGRAGDGSPRTTSTGAGGDDLPDPAGVDVWAVTSTGEGTSTLAWASRPGRWSLVALAVDGTDVRAPDQVDLTWRPAQGSSPAVALIAIGLLLLVGGAVAVAIIILQRRNPVSDDDADSASGTQARMDADVAEDAGPDAATGVAGLRTRRETSPAPLPAGPLTAELPVVPAGAVVSSRRAARAARLAAEQSPDRTGRGSDPAASAPRVAPPAAERTDLPPLPNAEQVTAEHTDPPTTMLPLGRHRSADLFTAQPLPTRRTSSPDAPAEPAQPFRFGSRRADAATPESEEEGEQP